MRIIKGITSNKHNGIQIHNKQVGEKQLQDFQFIEVWLKLFLVLIPKVGGGGETELLCFYLDTDNGLPFLSLFLFYHIPYLYCSPSTIGSNT